VSHLAIAGRQEAAAFVKELKDMGLKVTISGDLWSSHGTALFGIIIHGITKDWEMKELLAGAVPARLDSHTGEWVVEQTEEALGKIGLTLDDIHRALRDNGANMVKGWGGLNDSGCKCHTTALSTGCYTGHEDVSNLISKGRTQTTCLHQSTISMVRLNDIQKELGQKPSKPVADCPTRWSSTFNAMTWKRDNMVSLMLFDVRHGQAAPESWRTGRFDQAEWQVVADTVSILNAAATAEKSLQAKSYPTSDQVFPILDMLICASNPDAPVRQPWDGRFLRLFRGL
jgi:hypothetical protein